MNILFVSLGCDKNLVDTEVMLGLLAQKGHQMVDSEEMAELMPEVCQEPELALFGGEDGLDFYRRISREARDHLRMGGCLLFEIGWKQKDAVSALLEQHIGEPFALKDYGDNWRVVGAIKTK